jgi:hypothetical protein
MMNKSHMYFVDLCLLTQFTVSSLIVSSRSKKEVTVRFQKDVKSEQSTGKSREMGFFSSLQFSQTA